VLDAMARSGAITGRQRDTAKREPLTIVPLHHREATVASKAKGTEYFVEYVRQQLLRKYPEELILRGGLRVQTSLDLRLQGAAFDAVQAVLNRQGDPDAAVVAVDNDGRVVAMVGGRDWQQSKVNLAVGAEGGGRGRQGGSAFKPIVLAATLRKGYSVESSFPGPAKLVIPKADHGRDWEVSNFEDEAYDRINLVQATAQSVNTVYAQLIGAIGPDAAVAAAHDLGITSELEAVPSIALGTQNVSVLEMAGAYSTFARGGYHVDPQVVLKVTTADGAVIEDNRPARTKVLERSEAQTMNYVLRQVVEGGTGTAAAFGKTCAGKTGTTDDYGDAWFVGYTPRLTAAVWLGYAEGQSKPMDDVHGRKVNGGSFPAMIFSRFMARATRDTPSMDFGSQPSFGGRILGARVSGDAASATTTTTSPAGTTTTTRHAAVVATTAPPPTAPAPPPAAPAPAPATTSTSEPDED
jgi:penicillin-binding protein 1A